MVFASYYNLEPHSAQTAEPTNKNIHVPARMVAPITTTGLEGGHQQFHIVQIEMPDWTGIGTCMNIASDDS